MKAALVATLLGAVFASAIASPVVQNDGKKIVCYYGSWAVYRPGNGKFDVEAIDPFLCTHIIYGFIGLQEDGSHRMRVMDEYNELEENWGRGAMKRFTGLKKVNPNLKALVAIGGWNEGSEKYSNMAMTASSRRTFINSVIPFILEQGFDGLDLDWEYPANRENARPIDKQNFVHLCNELREELAPRGLLLTAAVGAGWKTVETAYDIPAVSNALDFINIMAYDFHGGWEDFTGHHSALGTSELDLGENATLNTEYAINYWIQGGADPKKLIVGIGTYGRGFVLDNPSQNGPYAPAKNPIMAGPFTREAGFWGYNELCVDMKAYPWTTVMVPGWETPYAYGGVNGRNWIGYDNEASVANKARWINARGLGGGMVWSIETDDFLGLCHEENFKITRTLARGVLGGDTQPPVTSSTTTTTQQPGGGGSTTTTTTTTTTQAPPPPPPSDHEICEREGRNAGPQTACQTHYYTCIRHGDNWIVHQQNCPPGTVLDPTNLNCVHAYSIGC